MQTNNYFKSIDGKKIFFNEWSIANPKGTIQIIHGMAEHSKRYKAFAKFLNERGYSVFATDHRGHGISNRNDELLGDIGKEGFDLMVEDEIFFARKIKEKHKLPHILLGHSMGSFIAQSFVQKKADLIDGLILSGSTANLESQAKFGEILALLSYTFLGIKVSNLLDRLSFGGYNKKTEKRTAFDWLSRDQKEVDKYINDSHCGFISPNILYLYLFRALKKLWKKENIERVPSNLAIFILSGDMDPVGKYGKGVGNLYELYRERGIEDLTLKLYEGGRHEMLNEINKVEVYEDLYNWIEKHLKKETL